MKALKSIFINSSSQKTIYKEIREGNLKAVKRIIEREESLLDCHNEGGYTPLQSAVHLTQVKIVEYLLEKRADIYLTDKQKQNVLVLAIYGFSTPTGQEEDPDRPDRCLEIIKLLLDHEVTLRRLDPNFWNKLLLKDMKDIQGLTIQKVIAYGKKSQCYANIISGLFNQQNDQLKALKTEILPEAEQQSPNDSHVNSHLRSRKPQYVSGKQFSSPKRLSSETFKQTTKEKENITPTEKTDWLSSLSSFPKKVSSLLFAEPKPFTEEQQSLLDVERKQEEKKFQ